MPQQPVFTRNFGNVKIKIWSYPKDVIRSLIIGLKRDSNTAHKITNVMGFKHSSVNYYHECNCKSKVEDICLKFSVNALRYGMIYIPLEIIDSSSAHELFICQLKSKADRCKNLSKVINVSPEDVNNNGCLLKLAENTKNISLKEGSCEGARNDQYNNRQKRYEGGCCETVDELVQPESDIDKIINLCLKFNIPPKEILILLKRVSEFHRNKNTHCGKHETCCQEHLKRFSNHIVPVGNDLQIPNFGEKMNTQRHPPVSGNNNLDYHTSNTHHPQTKYISFKRSVSTDTFVSSCNDEYDTDYSSSNSPDQMCSELQNQNSLSRLRKSKGQPNNQLFENSEVEKDIQHIKSSLKEIICLLNENGHQDERYQPEVEFKNSKNLEECHSSNDLEILESILQEWMNNRNARKLQSLHKNKKNIIAKVDSCEEEISDSEHLDIEEEAKNEIYRYLPQVIPVMPKLEDHKIVTVLDAYQNNVTNQSRRWSVQNNYGLEDINQESFMVPDDYLNLNRKSTKAVPSNFQSINRGPSGVTCDLPNAKKKSSMAQTMQEGGFTALNGFENNYRKSSMLSNASLNSATGSNNPQISTIKSVLEMAGVPPNVSDQVCRLTKTGNGSGITNIYYYVNSDTAKHLSDVLNTNGKLCKEREIIIEQQSIRKATQEDQKNVGETFSHIFVDFNNPQQGTELVQGKGTIESPILINVENSSEIEIPMENKKDTFILSTQGEGNP